MFADEDARAAIDREKNMGFRCVKDLPGQQPPKEAFAEVQTAACRDFLAEKPLSDDAFQLVKGYYAYDKAKPLNAVVERQEETAYWVHERVDGRCGLRDRAADRTPLPAQGGGAAVSARHLLAGLRGRCWCADVVSPTDEYLAFLVKSGRALVWPVYKGTYERKVQPPRRPHGSGSYFVQQAKDLSRTIDYLETRRRPQRRRSRLLRGELGGRGRGAGVGGRGPDQGGRPRRWRFGQRDPFERPEHDPVHYLPRITIPVLMLNGRYDSGFPPRSRKSRCSGCSAPTPRGRSIGSPTAVTWPLRSPERIQETLSWFDRYLGPVHAKGSPAVASD